MARRRPTVQQIVTDNILKKLESAPEWQKGWTITDIPRNYVSNRPYTGVNVFLIGMDSEHGSRSNRQEAHDFSRGMNAVIRTILYS